MPGLQRSFLEEIFWSVVLTFITERGQSVCCGWVVLNLCLSVWLFALLLDLLPICLDVTTSTLNYCGYVKANYKPSPPVETSRRILVVSRFTLWSGAYVRYASHIKYVLQVNRTPNRKACISEEESGDPKLI